MSYPSYKDIQKAREHLTEVSYNHWVHHDLWSFNWWILLIATFLPWVVWFRLVNRDRIFEVFSYAMGFGVTASILDVFGVDYEWWGYPDKLVAMMPPLFPADIAVLPVLYSLVYQYSSTWKKYMLYSGLVSALISYIIEPICKKMGIYENQHFTHTMSFIGFTILSLIIKWIMEAVKRFKVSGSK